MGHGDAGVRSLIELRRGIEREWWAGECVGEEGEARVCTCECTAQRGRQYAERAPHPVVSLVANWLHNRSRIHVGEVCVETGCLHWEAVSLGVCACSCQFFNPNAISNVIGLATWAGLVQPG
jgi:hypothetical protein